MRLLLGVIGSVSIAIGSLGVGWLGPSSALRGWLVFELLRNSRGAVTLSGLLVVGGALLLLAAWVALGVSLLERRSSRGGVLPASAEAPGTAGSGDEDARRTASQVRTVAISATAWSIPLLFALPLFSRDMFAYVGQGRLMAAGLNPYSTGMADLPGWFGLGVDPLWADTQTPYGPVFVWLEKLVVMSTDALPPEVAIFAFRFLAVAGLAMLAFYAWRIARLRGLNQAGVLWIVAASPLVIMNFVVAGHNDSLMLGFIVAGVYYAMKDRPILGTVFVALAIGVKPIALIALPIIGLIWAGSNAGWPAIIRRWSAVAAVGVGGVVLLGWGIGVGVGWIGALATPVTISSWYAPANILGISIGGLVNGFGLDGDLAQTVVKLVLLAAGCAAAAYLLITKRRADPLWLLGGCFALIVLASPVIHPWYGLWLLTLLALVGVDRLWRIRTVLYATAFFMLIGLAEPMDLIPRLDTDTMIPVAVIGTAIVGVAAVLVSAEMVTRRTVAVRGLRVPRLSAPSTPSR
ncbi:polyprenol phosphomannose-dependent alpha 1,6 mannosyltransferase MptB [Herbiconiux sp. UC225_62]|uniref:polyprenol phosphomannose-dependent alpha 1,6 mannosyltransferase MptB n=1 Tax=Herbiconiux sp. UC225_62 TaxID=3350168 RepID=UPI0036D2EB12